MSMKKKFENPMSDSELDKIVGGAEVDDIHIQIPIQQYVCHTPKPTPLNPLAVCGYIWTEPAGDPHPQCPDCGGYEVAKLGPEGLTP